MEVFDEPEEHLPVPSFASELRLTVGELFGWLLDWAKFRSYPHSAIAQGAVPKAIARWLITQLQLGCVSRMLGDPSANAPPTLQLLEKGDCPAGTLRERSWHHRFFLLCWAWWGRTITRSVPSGIRAASKSHFFALLPVGALILKLCAILTRCRNLMTS